MHQEDTCHRQCHKVTMKHVISIQFESRFISGSRGEGGAAQHEAGGPHQAADQGAQERPGRPREREKTQKSSK